MLRNKVCYSFIVTLVFIVLSPIASKAENISKSPWALEIVSADKNELPKTNDHPIHPIKKIDVILRNISEKPQRIWKESNSWGYSVLYFEVVDEKSGKNYIRKKPKNWRKNFPEFLTIDAGQSLVYNISFMNEDWDIFSSFFKLKNFNIQAILDIPEDSQAKQYGVWTGTAKSNVLKFEIIN